MNWPDFFIGYFIGVILVSGLRIIVDLSTRKR